MLCTYGYRCIVVAVLALLVWVQGSGCLRGGFDDVTARDGGSTDWVVDSISVTDWTLDQSRLDGPIPEQALVDAQAVDGGISSWSKGFGGGTLDRGHDVVLDTNGNLYVVGSFEGTVDFGGGGRTSAGSSDIFLASFSPNGKHRWSKRFGGSSADVGRSVAVDAGGNVYITGSFQGTVDFGGGARAGAGKADIFVASFSSTGTHRWSKGFGGPSPDGGYGVAVDASNVYVTGQFEGAADLGGGGLLMSAGSYDLFLISLTSAGAYRWSKGFGGSGMDIGRDVATDTSGNVYVTGLISGTVDFGGGKLTSAGMNDIFVASFASTGAHRWSKGFGGVSMDSGQGVATDANGNVHVTGSFYATVDFGGNKLTTAGFTDIFIASFTTTGQHRWSQRFGGMSLDHGAALAVDASGNVYATGSFYGPVDFGGGQLTSAGGGDIYVASFTTTGQHRWSQRFGGSAADEGNGVAVGSSGNTYVTGSFTGTVDFGSGSLTSAGDADIFLISTQ